MKTLKLTIKKQWFDMILFGQKTEEYREVKQYWVDRLLCAGIFRNDTFKKWFENMPDDVTFQHVVNKFDLIEFTNGYNKKSPQVTLECKGIEIGTGKKEWGAIENKTYFIIKLGSEVSRKNC